VIERFDARDARRSREFHQVFTDLSPSPVEPMAIRVVAIAPSRV
jgi:hypothetical protein